MHACSLAFGLSLILAAAPAIGGEARLCFGQLPGNEQARIDAHANTKIIKIAVGPPNVYAHVATEYLGAGNLQAEVYLREGKSYCLAGAMGAATDFRAGKPRADQALRDIVVDSKSGPSRFQRTFRYTPASQTYELAACQTRTAGKKWRKCSANEFDER